MVKKKDFLAKARENPKNVPFRDMLKFLDDHCQKKRSVTGGSHVKYIVYGQLVTLQPDKSDHKLCPPYQVRQVLNIFDDIKLGGRK